VKFCKGSDQILLPRARVKQPDQQSENPESHPPQELALSLKNLN